MPLVITEPMSMMDAALLLQDPPEIMEEGGIKPMNQWPGRRMARADVIKAAQNGYGRDWFRFWHRYLRFQEIWEEGGVFDQARAHMTDEDYFKVFHWSQTLVFGDYGNGKSTWFGSRANHWAQFGIPSFHNGLYLGGWIFEGDESFVMMASMPKVSVLGHDEASGTAGRNFHQTIALQMLLALGVNIRKMDVDWYLIGRKWQNLPRELLDDCETAIEILKTDIQVEGQPEDLEPWNNPANFQLRWQGWNDYPHRKMLERKKQRRRDGEDYDEEEEGFGPPDFEGQMDPHVARVCYALTDSFRLADLPGFLANKDKVRGILAGTRDTAIEDERKPGVAAVLEFTAGLRQLMEEGDDIQWVRPADISQMSGFTPQMVGQSVAELGIQKHRDKGYLAQDLIRAWQREMGLGG